MPEDSRKVRICRETRRSRVLEINNKRLEIGLKFWLLVGLRLGLLRYGNTRARFCVRGLYPSACERYAKNVK